MASQPASDTAQGSGSDPAPARAAGALARLRQELAESPPLWWALLYFFSLLCGYYVLRPVRDAMGATADVAAIFPPSWVAWAEANGFALRDFVLQFLFTCTFLSMLALQPLYGALVSRYPRRVFLPALYLLFIACLFGFWWIFDREVAVRGALFFVWVAVFNLFAVSVFWSYMADVFDNDHAKRVYGYIGAGGTIGALLGPFITQQLVGRIGIDNLLLVSAGFMGLCLLCIVRLRPWALRREHRSGQTAGEAMGGSIWAGFRLVAREPLLRGLALLLFFGVGVGTLLYSEQAAIVRQYYPTPAEAAQFYARIDLAINACTIVVQLLVTRWLLRRYGVAPALLIPAFGILIGYAMLAMSPLPLLVAIVQVGTRAGEFSLGKPARETLYTRVDREARYKAKAFIDTAVYRAGDLTYVWLHKWLATFGSTVVFLAGTGIAAAMLLSVLQVIRAQRRLPP
jgi:AAA family ATP:ADP antiporter